MVRLKREGVLVALWRPCFTTLHSGMDKAQDDDRETHRENRGAMDAIAIGVFVYTIFEPSSSLENEKIAILERIDGVCSML
jgi:hypothetical protein